MSTQIWSATRMVAVLAAFLVLPQGALPSRPASAKPAPEIAKLKFLEGDWKYEVVTDQGIVSPSIAITKTVGACKTTEGPAGLSLISDFTEHTAEGDTTRHEVTVWDADSAAYKTYVFKSSSPQAEIRTGRWIEGKLVFDYEYAMGVPMRSTTVANADGTVTTFHNDKTGRGRLVFTVNAKRVSESSAGFSG